MKKLFLLLFSVVVMNIIFAQQTNCWTAHNSNDLLIPDKTVNRLSFPKSFLLYDLNFGTLKTHLMSVTSESINDGLMLSFPNADGKEEQFKVYESSNFEPSLQAAFPEIRAFAGNGITDRSAVLKLSLSPQGIQATVFRADADNEYLEPYSQDHSVYAVYRSQKSGTALPWKCYSPDESMTGSIDHAVSMSGILSRSGGDLKTLRLAQSVTAEYSNYFGATSASQVSLVLAAINATLTRCNGVYERDLAIHLNLITATTSLIYYNPATDPYDDASTGAAGNWNAQLQNTLTAVIGEANYDIGHLFGASGGGGNAGCIGCICMNGSKGSGYTSPADGVPQGDNFDIDYVVHEVGHQLGANHTFSMSNEATGVNKEVGSGITIMGYAGITSQDVSPHSFDMYHETSIAQIQTNLLTKTCPVTISITTANTAPLIASLASYIIPKSTPFVLTGSATDVNSDALTYCWEQNDNASATQTGTASVASETKATGPNWISLKPTSSPTRYFPQLATILSGGNITGPFSGGDAGANTEALSSVARTLNFRLTVRDNSAYRSTAPVKVGQTSFADMTVTVSSASGPFVVTSPNTAVTWLAGSSQVITWNVANTTAAPVSCANVKISLSTDGGLSFPFVVAASTPNDGTETIVLPVVSSATARIKIEAIGNIFFDISNTNFSIVTSICNTVTGMSASIVTSTSAVIGWNQLSGAIRYNVQYRISGTTAWTTASVTTNSITLTGLTASKNYEYQVQSVCSATSSGVYSSLSYFTTPAPGCSDNFEPNNSYALAKPVSANGSVIGLISNYADADWFSITTASPATNLKLSLSGMAVDYDMILYNASLSQIGSSSNLGNTTEQITYNTNVPGTYYVKVNGNSNRTLTQYNFSSATAAPTIADTKLIISSLAQGNNLGTTTFISATSASSGYTGASGGYNAGITARTGVLNTAASGSAYYEFTMVPNSGNAVSLSGISFASRSTSTGPTAFAIRSSLDGFATNVATGSLLNSSVWSVSNVTGLTLNASVGVAVTIRIYGYNGIGTASANVANWRIDDLSVSGSASGFHTSQCYTLLTASGSSAFKQAVIAHTESNFKVYPNPSHQLVSLSCPDEMINNATLMMYDAKGIQVRKMRVTGNNKTLDVSSLRKGMYFLKLVNGETTYTTNFIRD